MTCNGLNGQGDAKLYFREQIDRYKAFHDDPRGGNLFIDRSQFSLASNDITSTTRFAPVEFRCLTNHDISHILPMQIVVQVEMTSV